MKTLFFITLISLTAVFSSCSKVNDKNAVVIKDCTGSYLRINEKDFHVCNDEILSDYTDGEEVEASFTKVVNCSNDTLVVCELYHQNEGWIEVTEVE